MNEQRQIMKNIGVFIASYAKDSGYDKNARNEFCPFWCGRNHLSWKFGWNKFWRLRS